MSLTKLIEDREVATHLDRIIPRYENRIEAMTYVQPQAERGRRSVIGTALDYALRFELQRRNPHAIARRWIAEGAQQRLEMRHLLRQHNVELPGQAQAKVVADYSQPRRWFGRIVKEARRFHQQFIRRRRAESRLLKALATHALRLSALDPYFRAGYLDPHPYVVRSTEVEEVVELLRAAPFDRLCHPKLVLLNPTFGLLSELVGGADADIICGDRLIDIKTVAEGKADRQSVRQLVGYLLLARRARQLGERVPEIRSIEIYFSRHGAFWSLPVVGIAGHPLFDQTERWFMERIGLPRQALDQPVSSKRGSRSRSKAGSAPR